MNVKEEEEKKEGYSFWSFMLPWQGTRMFFFFSLTCAEGGDADHRRCYCACAHGTRQKVIILMEHASGSGPALLFTNKRDGRDHWILLITSLLAS